MTILHRVASLIALSWLVSAIPCAAQDYPSRPVKMIVPFGAGGPTDIFTRLLAEELRKSLKEPFVMENRPGAGTIIGTDAAAKSPPDGYTLLMISATQTTTETLVPNKPFKLLRDFVPVASLLNSELVMVVHPSVPVNTVKEFIALAKSKPGALNYASSGVGSNYHMAGELFKNLTGTDILHVPYKGSSGARNDIISGQIEMMFDSLPSMAPMIHAGRVKALGTTGKVRSAILPDVPTLSEAGGARLRSDDLDRRHGAHGNAAADRHLAQHRDQQDPRAPRREGGVGEAGRNSDDHEARGIRSLRAVRDRQVGKSHQSQQHKA
jgi:tripartite-type tricarboxylate transporter receptor subunit TctC